MNIAEEIQRLQELHRSGALTDAEFAQAKAAVLAGRGAADHGGGGAHCYKCDAVPERACALCGHMFCARHGGEREIWLSADGSKYGGRNVLTRRVLCDDCTPDPVAMKQSKILFGVFAAFVLGFMLLVMGFILYGFLSFPRF